MAAFAGESQARNKYTFYSALAKKNGYEQIARIFTETANNEKEHAEIWFKLLRPTYPDTEGALRDAAGDEHYEFSEMYAGFAKTAKEEGFDKIAFLFDSVAKIEKTHYDRFTKLADNVKNQQVFKKPQTQIWVCLNCGHVYEGTSAPEVCPVCAHKQAYFEISANNY